MRDEGLSETEFAEHVNNSFHGRLICYGDRGHVEDLLQVERRRP